MIQIFNISIGDETHMIRKRSNRLFVEDCDRLAVRREFVEAGVPSGNDARLVPLRTEDAWPTLFDLKIVPTAQRLGGRRWWWQCPKCERRCAVLLRPSAVHSFVCRVCLSAVYKTDYPSRYYWNQLGETLRRVLYPNAPGTLTELLAPRRRGVQRGRRVKARAARLAAKFSAKQTADILEQYWKRRD